MKSSTATTKLTAAAAAVAIMMMACMSSAPAADVVAFSPNNPLTTAGHNRRMRTIPSSSSSLMFFTPPRVNENNSNNDDVSSSSSTLVGIAESSTHHHNHHNSFKNNIMELYSTTATSAATTTDDVPAAAAAGTSSGGYNDAAQTMANVAAAAATAASAASSPSSSHRQQQLETVIATVTTAVTALVLFERYDVADASVFNTAFVTLGHHLTQLPLQAYQAYEQVLLANPITTKAATSATVYTIGDIVAQFTEQQQQQPQSADNDDNISSFVEIDTGRVVRSLVAGGIGHGPLSHVWYHLSEQFFNLVGLTSAEAGWWSVIPKIAIDQIVWGTIWNSLYLSSVGIMQLAMAPHRPQKQAEDDMTDENSSTRRLSLSNIQNVLEETKSSIVPLFVDGLKLWPFAHIITYGVIPVEDRLLWVDAVEIIWVAIMATKAAENKTKTDSNTSTKTTTTTLVSSPESVTTAAP